MNEKTIRELTENSELIDRLKPLFNKAMGFERKAPAALINCLSYALIQGKAGVLDAMTKPFAEQCYLETLAKYPEDVPEGKRVVEVEVDQEQEMARVRVGKVEFIVKVRGRVRRLVDEGRGPKLRLIRGGER